MPPDRSTRCALTAQAMSGSPAIRLGNSIRGRTNTRKSPEVPSAYDVKADHDGNIWFTKTGDPNAIGMVDYKTMKVSLWEPLTKDSFPRRIEVDANGIVWSGEFRGGKMLRFDPKTQDMKEFQFPGPMPTPYGLGIDAKGNVWYASYNMDVLGCFDPKTGKTVEYPFPHSENTIRELIPRFRGTHVVRHAVE